MKPRNSYIFYMAHMNKVVRSEFPDVDFGRIAEIVAGRWAALPDAERRVSLYGEI